MALSGWARRGALPLAAPPPGEERFELVQGGAQVLALLVDHNGTLWAGTERTGLLRFRNGRLTRFLQDDGLLLRLEQMREALARADARDLAGVAHGLKGSSAQLGLARVSALSFEVERGAGADLRLVPPLLSALESELARVAPCSPSGGSARASGEADPLRGCLERGNSAASTVETPRGASPKPGRRLRSEETPHGASLQWRSPSRHGISRPDFLLPPWDLPPVLRL